MGADMDTYKISIIIAVYNNGKYLYRCINSLKRSSMYDQLEIIIIDDGSTDNETRLILRQINREEKNVQIKFFKKGGSGSASRARNYGISMASAEYIIYLDPDDEPINDGYAKLYNAIVGTDYDLVMGDISMLNKRGVEKRRVYYKDFVRCNNGKESTRNGKEMLKALHFRSGSLFAAIMRKSLILDNHVVMIEGAAGQDTLMHYELMALASHIKVIDEVVYRYYFQISTSVTNSRNLEYLRKHYRNEVYKAEILKRYGLYDMYVELKLEEFFFTYIYIPALKLPEQDQKEGKEIVQQIYNLYKDKWRIKRISMKEYLMNGDVSEQSKRGNI